MMKKFLLSLCVGFLGIISFCNAGNYTVFSQTFTETCSDCSVSITDVNSDLVCIVNDTCGYYDFLYNFDHGGWAGNATATDGHLFGGLGICSSDIIYYSTVGCNYTVNYITVDIEDILSGNVDTNYCVENNLCPVSDFSGDLQYSNFYINDILHPGTENIFLNIQDNIFWDYSLDENGLVVDVGSGYDQDYIDGVIDVQSYRPTSEDFTQTFVGGLILFTPYVVILLFVILVWNLIKKIFKTK